MNVFIIYGHGGHLDHVTLERLDIFSVPPSLEALYEIQL